MSLKVNLVYTSVVNFAMQQNHAPVVREIKILNDSDTPISDISIRLSFEPAFALEFNSHIEIIEPGCEETFEDLPISLSTLFLSNLTERVLGEMRLNISSGEELLFHQSYEISVLTFNEWGGIDVLPEMLAAFSTPNHPELTRIIKKASVLLDEWTGSPSLDEYQTRDPNRVKQQMAAIYSAISSENITYGSVPASFESSGQRIRLADEVLGSKLGNCLDMSMLYVSCLEAIGLHPIVVISKGHAFAGCWLVRDSFADSINDDPSLLTKRIAEGINEILVVETTCMNSGSMASFDDACIYAFKKLVSNDFILFLDIYRARIGQIRPLPMRIAGSEGWTLIEDTATERTFEAPEELNATDIIIDKKADVNKKTIWERKLLDLSLRNNLLNTRLTRDTIPIISVHLNELEDALAANQDFQVLAKPADWDNSHISAGIYSVVNASDPIYELVKMELSQRRIRTYLDEDKVKRALTNLYRSSRTALEENGANTLYLALGLLKWFETPSSKKPRYSPILLLPIEIIRKSAASGYIIRSRDEETMLNITLLELLRQAFGITIGGLNPLPTDESGVDVSLIFNTIRKKIMDQKGWDVIEQAILGNFSFNKFIMWNDIHNNTAVLQKSKIVSSLMTGIVDPSVNQSLSEEDNIDEKFNVGDIKLPISADSSQLEAINAALSGKSFILHGPPGTGKSQTITNIIANALYKGKRVLFVAEKMAALEVVQNRLETLGLGPFCLELHSNKAKKSNVLEQLKRTTEVAKKKSSEDYLSEANQINTVRKDMNAHVQSTQKKYPLGVSFYDCISRYCTIDDNCPEFVFGVNKVGSFEANQIKDAEVALSEYRTACSVIGDPNDHPLKGISVTEYTPSTLTAFDAIDTLKNKSDDLYNEAAILQDSIFGRIAEHLTENHYRLLSEAVSMINESDSRISPVLKIGEGDILKSLSDLCKHGIERDTERHNLLKLFDESILELDTIAYDTEWRTALAKGFITRFFATNKVLKKLQTYSTSGTKPSKDEVLPLIKSVTNYQRERKAVEDRTKGLLSSIILECGEDWEFLISACDNVRSINSSLSSLITDDSQLKIVRNKVASYMDKGATSSFPPLFNDVIDGRNHIENTLNSSFSAYDEDWAKSISHQCLLWESGRDQLRSWVLYNQKRSSIIKLGFEEVVNQIEQGSIPLDDLLDSFHKGLYKAYAEYILTQDQTLTLFHGAMFEEKIARFRGLCKDFEALTREEIFAKLASNLPALQKEASQNSEVGILQRNIRNGCRGVSLRSFFDSISDLLPRLCPCMLMSPISVAQYIDANAPKFDIVIFDEASQMPTCEAVGAIARGNSIIVVGDPKQMPPTNFFSTNTFDEDNPNMEDLESILDDCLALSFPSKYLRWHYRSKHESLIAFSNVKYYDNKLLTFPSPDDIKTKIQYRHITGTYDRGGTRQNRAEAEAVVEEICHRLTDPTLSKRSIGVVTFNSNQQTLIEDLLTDLFSIRPDLEKVALSSEEPIFVKNLENVQGDERDVILFSVGYGQDKDGKVALNFGPLNRDGGWRRLNVAVSRARYEMKVFSSLTSDQIDLKRSSALGVAGLKAFLEYAEKGRTALRYNSTESSIGTDGLVETIADSIRNRGYEVRTNVGCSGYRIDIGVVNPDNTSDYVLGILCDGYNYSASKTARDREIVQIGILRKLGWKIMRVWTLDWWNDKDAVLDSIVDKINSALNGTFEEKEEEPIHPFSSNTFMKAISGDSSSTSIVDESMAISDAAANTDSDTTPNGETSEFVIPYEVCTLRQKHVSADDFISGKYKSLIMKDIRDVLTVEGPISCNLLCKRVLRAFDISRMGSRVEGYMDRLLHSMLLKTTRDSFITYWSDEQDPTNYPYIRYSNYRDAADIPTREAFNAALLVLEEQGALPVESLVKEMAKLFGFSRVGDNVSNAMLDGIDYAKEWKFVEEINGKIRKKTTVTQ